MSKEIMLVIVVALVFFSLSAFITLFVIIYQRRQMKFTRTTEELKTNFNQQLLQTQLEVQEHSFNQISGELHDNVGQLLSSTKMLLGIVERGIQQQQWQHVPNALVTADETLSKAIHDLRSLSRALNKDWLRSFNLIENLDAETKRINQVRAMYISFASQFTTLPMEPEAQIILFRIVQEALQNSMKHANAEHIVIEIKNESTAFVISVADDGVGFNPDLINNNGLGLRNMKQRTELLGGSITWQTENNGGTKLLISIPFKNEKTLNAERG